MPGNAENLQGLILCPKMIILKKQETIKTSNLCKHRVLYSLECLMDPGQLRTQEGKQGLHLSYRTESLRREPQQVSA